MVSICNSVLMAAACCSVPFCPSTDMVTIGAQFCCMMFWSILPLNNYGHSLVFVLCFSLFIVSPEQSEGGASSVEMPHFDGSKECNDGNTQTTTLQTQNEHKGISYFAVSERKFGDMEDEDNIYT
ncbi:hypothetical protein LXL04_011574 [Taraxacum kok-saghyz]